MNYRWGGASTDKINKNFTKNMLNMIFLAGSCELYSECNSFGLVTDLTAVCEDPTCSLATNKDLCCVERN